MPDMRGEVFSFPIEVFRLLAPRLEAWKIVQSSLPCWRLWWNSNPGASVLWHGKRFDLRPGCFVLVAPETCFTVELGRPIERHLFIHFGLSTQRWQKRDHVFEVKASSLTRRMATSLARKLPKDPDISFEEPLLGISLVSAVFSELDHARWQPELNDQRMRNVMTVIEGNPGAGWSNEAMAKLAAMSTGGFVRRFRKSTGQSPQRFLLQQRLGLARRLLLQSNLSIDAITERCGFCDRSYFSTVFRCEVGVAPASFRNQAAQTG